MPTLSTRSTKGLLENYRCGGCKERKPADEFGPPRAFGRRVDFFCVTCRAKARKVTSTRRGPRPSSTCQRCHRRLPAASFGPPVEAWRAVDRLCLDCRNDPTRGLGGPRPTGELLPACKCDTCGRRKPRDLFGPPRLPGRRCDKLCLDCRSLGREPNRRSDAPCCRCGAAVSRNAKGERSCPVCTRLRRLADPWTHKRYPEQRLALMARQSDGTITFDALHGLVASHDACAYCASALPLEARHLDHIVPISHAGLHGMANLAVACEPCNRRKGPKPFGAWLLKLDAKHRARAETLYRERFGASDHVIPPLALAA